MNVMAKAFPASRFTGFDFAEESVATGRKEAAQLGLTNARFEIQDVAALNLENAFDLIPRIVRMPEWSRANLQTVFSGTESNVQIKHVSELRTPQSGQTGQQPASANAAPAAAGPAPASVEGASTAKLRFEPAKPGARRLLAMPALNRKAGLPVQ